jgi:hypothetical protein
MPHDSLITFVTIRVIRGLIIRISEWIETTRSLGREIPVPRGRLVYA